MTTETAKSIWADRIYSSDWKAWKDPQVPEWLSPVETLLGQERHKALADKTALIIGEQRISYAALRALASRAAGGLEKLGFHVGERLLFFATDSLEYLVFWLGALHAGVVPVVVSDLYKTKDLLYFLRDTDAAGLLIDEEQLEKLREIGSDLPQGLRHVIIRAEGAPAKPALPGKGVVGAADLLKTSEPVAPVPRHANDVCYMFYSGGTTGTAKGITHLAHDFVLVPERQGAYWEYAQDDVVFATSKKYFTHGLWPGFLIPLYWGATAVVSRPPPSPDNVISLVQTHRVTKLISVPTVLKNLVEAVRDREPALRFPALQMVVSASEKIPPDLFETFERLFGVEIFDSIGSSEITYEWIANRPKEHRRGSLGKPIFGYEIRLVDPDGNAIDAPNSAGEAWVKSRTACFFYWRKFDKSRETFVGPWARTGDNLYFDEDGFFWFSSRGDDVFKVRGLWVSPLEVEAALTAQDSVLEAAVVPFTDSDGLTKPKAYVVLRAGFSADEAMIEALKAAVKVLGGYKVPAMIVFVDKLPRTTLMKIDRRALRSLPENQGLTANGGGSDSPS